jgi:hypothetical protein
LSPAQRPAKSSRPGGWTIVAIAIPLVLVAACALLLIEFRTVRTELLGYCRIKLNDDRREVTYRLGGVPMVLGGAAGDGLTHLPPIYYADAAVDSNNPIPAGKSVDDFADWEYLVDADAPKGPYFLVHFAQDQRVATVRCTDLTFGAPNTCAPIGGVSIGESEEDMVATLGAPSRSTIDGVAKKVEYLDLGVEIYLTQGRVYSLALTRGNHTDMDMFLSYLNRAYITRIGRL